MRTDKLGTKFLWSLVLLTVVYQLTLFVNISASQVSGIFVNDQSLSIPNAIDYLIISTDQFLDELQPLVTWKSQRGLIVNTKTIETISPKYEGDSLTEKIRHCIQDYYRNNKTTWVVLAGGEDFIPSKSLLVDGVNISCDSYYGNLDNDWLIDDSEITSIVNGSEWKPEVYVGRLPADNENQMKDLVDRIIDYEKNPPPGSWMNTALFGGTFANFNSDSNNNDRFDEDDWKEFDTNRNHNWLRNNVIPSHWTSVMLGEVEGLKTTDYPYDYPTSQDNLVQLINSGAGIVQIDAHGSSTEMYRSIFAADVDGDNLFDQGEDIIASKVLISTLTEFETNGKNGLYFLAACSTGSFNEGTSLTEYIVRNSGIGCIGSSESSYYDSEIYTEDYKCWVTQGLLYRFWVRMFTEDTNHPGQALALAKDAYAEDCKLNLRNENGDLRTLTQYNLMGDPEVPIWIKTPSQLESFRINNTDQLLILSSNEPIDNAWVTLTNSTYYWRGITNSEGKITLPNDINRFEQVNITVSKNNFFPSQKNLSTVQIFSGVLESNSTPFSFLGIVLAVALLARKEDN
ncbi:MAG: C25 family cysteine peptidase [Candidatus Heimdallarchaeota archaeon]